MKPTKDNIHKLVFNIVKSGTNLSVNLDSKPYTINTTTLECTFSTKRDIINALILINNLK